MTDEEIEKAMNCCRRSLCNECPLQNNGFCQNRLSNEKYHYINRLKAEIAGLTGALEALESDRDNLLRTLEEANERAEEIRKGTAKAVLREILGWGEYEPLYDRDESGYVRIKHIKSEIAKYGVEVDE